MEDLAQYLAEAPLDFLRTLAHNLNIKIPGEQKNKRGQRQEERKSLYEALVAFFQEDQNLEKLWQSLGEPERFFLELVHFNSSSSSGAEALRVNEKLNRLWGKDTAWEVRKRVLDYGLVFVKQERFQREYFLLPREVRNLIYNQKIWTLIEPLRKEDQDFESHGLFLLLDFYILLASVLQWEVKVAQAGHIYKKDRKRILSLQHFPNEEMRYELLERLAWGLQFLVEGEGRATLGKVAWEWLELPQAEQWEMFTSWLLEPHFEGSQVWAEHIMSFLFLAPRNRWLSLSNLYRLVADYNSGSTLELALRDIKELIQKLTWLGLIELKGDLDKGAIRLSQLGLIYGEKSLQRSLKEDEGVEIPEERVQKLKEALEKHFPEVEDIVVQPDFEILAPLEISPGLLFEVVTFADLKSADRAFIFKLNERTLYRGFLKGRMPGDVLGLLEEHSKYPLPSNVRVSLEDWGSRMGQIYLERGLLVRCLKEELSGQIKAFLEARGWLIEEIAPGVFLIPENIARRCLLELEWSGFFPQPQVREHRLPYLVEEQLGEEILSEVVEKFLGLKFK
ncbi:Helicase conserved C-terminal domain-containing protein [Thermanaeromonas toyohensis ToBE]|uniref:Helicase conserved C-terminal domain-containing protein n=1 Tax=Thermanaeromonas toyohensis ToBE TaxID=698762 RepID=A0A1W1W3M2_9FIRM|nr:helicase-associated domain-containing protein [Thermanaeromonas toyohensis]SMB99971.1 Helicase conserved C-terminal domain-containing protein [Thermanaeromonas toyohensis ToBE]